MGIVSRLLPTSPANTCAGILGRLWLFLAWAVMSASAWAAENEPAGTTPAQNVQKIISQYTALCNNKSSCTLADTLTIAPVPDNQTRLDSVVLNFKDFFEKMPVSPPGNGAQPTLTYPLAPMILDWLGKESSQPKAKEFFQRSDVKVPVMVEMRDKAGRSHTAEFLLDVTSLWKEGTLAWNSLEKATVSRVWFNDELKLTVLPQLGGWRKAMEAEYEKLHLVLDGVRIPALDVSGAEDNGTLVFRLKRSSDNLEAWQPILESALHRKPKEISVAIVNDRGWILARDGKMQLQTKSFFSRASIVFFSAAVLAALLFQLGSTMKWSWLRDDYGIPVDVLPVEDRPFSLGKFQMLFWTYAVLVATVAILTVFFEIPNVTSTAFTLMGISVGTAVASVAIVPESVTQAIKAYETSAKDQAAIDALKEKVGSSKNFLQDILRDYASQGTDFHRLQVLLMTLAIGTLFVVLAFQAANYPTINDALLAAMGISGGSYVGFKWANR